MHRSVLQPNETGELEVEMDTSRFVGKKTVGLLLTTKRGEVPLEFAITIAGISDRSP